MPFAPDSDIATQVSELVDLYAGVTAMRLVSTVETLSGDWPEQVKATSFSYHWELFSCLSGRQLRRALLQPSVSLWLARASHLLARHSRYETNVTTSIVGELLRAFSIVLLDVAPLLPGRYAEGTARLETNWPLSLWLGRAMLHNGPGASDLFHWIFRDGQYTFSLPNRKQTWILSWQRDIRVLHLSPGLELELAVLISGVAVYGRSVDGTPVDECANAAFRDKVKTLIASFSPQSRKLLSTSVVWIVPASVRPTERVRAGLSLQLRFRSVDLYKELTHQLTTIAEDLYRFRTGASLWSDIGYPSPAYFADELAEELFPNVRVRRQSQLSAILEACIKGDRLTTANRDNNRHLDFAAEARLAGGLSSYPDQWKEPKCAGNEPGQAIVWRLLDEFVALDPELRRGLLANLECAAKSEKYFFAIACDAYNSGQFRKCVRALTACIEFDANSETYWMLLALTCRHLGLRKIFEQIVFAGERSRCLLDRALGGSRASE